MIQVYIVLGSLAISLSKSIFQFQSFISKLQYAHLSIKAVCFGKKSIGRALP